MKEWNNYIHAVGCLECGLKSGCLGVAKDITEAENIVKLLEFQFGGSYRNFYYTTDPVGSISVESCIKRFNDWRDE